MAIGNIIMTGNKTEIGKTVQDISGIVSMNERTSVVATWINLIL